MKRTAVTLCLLLLPALAQAQAPCTTIALSKSPTNQDAPFPTTGPNGGLASVWVTASTPDCTWTVLNSAGWISLPDGTTGSGSRWLRLMVAPNAGADGRSATIQVAANQVRTFTVFQTVAGLGPGLMQSPVGASASPSTAVVAQPFRVSGYAIDTRATSGPGVSGVDIYWRDIASGPALFLLGQATYGSAHPHVADVLGSEFLNSGFEFEVSGVPPPAAGTERTVSIEAYAHSAVDGTTLAAGATRVTVINPRLTLSPSALQFAAVSGAAPLVTPAQPIGISGFGWQSTWTATSAEPWIVLSPASGTGPGSVTVSIDPAQLPAAGTLIGGVHVGVSDVPGGQVDVGIRLDVSPPGFTAAPYGAFDPPPSPTVGAVPLGGWALDDVGVANVAIYRSRTASEGGQGLVFIGNATFVEGARPDVAAVYPTAPQRTRAGWGYMLLSNVLPEGGNGTYTFFAYATDVEGRQTLLGGRDVTIANASADIPFGALDAPAPGQTVSGMYTMGGWALTVTPSNIARVIFYMDGQPIGVATYGLARPDVAALFGGANAPPDVNAAGFRFTIDTRGLANGLHTIAVIAVSNNSDVAGLGSRFFTVRNP